MSERENSHDHLHHVHEKSVNLLLKILHNSLQILWKNKRHFLWIFLLQSFPLSALIFTLSLCSRPLKSHILHLESLLRHSPTRFEFRHVFSESRHDAFSLLRLRAAFSVPIAAFSLLAAVSAVSAALSHPHPRPLKSTLPRPLLTSLTSYAALLAFSLLPNTLAALSPSPPLRLLVLAVSALLEIYLISILGLAIVVSIAEDRFGFGAIRVAATLVADRRICAWSLTAVFVVASSWISAAMDGAMDGVDHWMRSTAAVTAGVVVGVGDKVGLISLYGVVIIFGYVVTAVFYCECRKKDFVRVDGDDDDHILMV